MAYRALPRPAYFNLHHVGGYKLRSAEATVRSAVFRFAWGRESLLGGVLAEDARADLGCEASGGDGNK